MTPFLNVATTGDALEILRKLPNESADLVVANSFPKPLSNEQTMALLNEVDRVLKHGHAFIHLREYCACCRPLRDCGRLRFDDVLAAVWNGPQPIALHIYSKGAP